VKLDTIFITYRRPAFSPVRLHHRADSCQTLPFIYRVLPILANLGRYLSSSRRAEDEHGYGRRIERNPDYFARSDSKFSVRKMEWDF